MHSWWSAPLGNVRVLRVCFAGTVSELKVASGKPKRKHCSKRISQEQKEKENSKKSRPFKQMPPGRAPVFLLFPGINTRGTTLPPSWIYAMQRGLVSANQTFFASEIIHRRKMSTHALQKMTRHLFRAMSLAPRQKCPRNVVEMKEAMVAFVGSDSVVISCHCKRSKIILVKVLT